MIRRPHLPRLSLPHLPEDPVRLLKALVGLVAGLLVVVTVMAAIWYFDARQVHGAICNLRDGAEGRVAAGVRNLKDSEELLNEYTDDELLRQFKLTRKQANERLQNQRGQLERDRLTVERLSGVRCGGYW